MAKTAALAGGVVGTASTDAYTNTLADNLIRTIVLRVVNKAAADADLSFCRVATPGVGGGTAREVLPTNLTLKAKEGGVEITKVLMPGSAVTLQASVADALVYTVDQIYSEPV